jgi:hypothetical protein
MINTYLLLPRLVVQKSEYGLRKRVKLPLDPLKISAPASLPSSILQVVSGQRDYLTASTLLDSLGAESEIIAGLFHSDPSKVAINQSTAHIIIRHLKCLPALCKA